MPKEASIGRFCFVDPPAQGATLSAQGAKGDTVNFLPHMFYLAADKGKGGGPAGDGEDDTPNPADELPQDARQGFQRLVDRHGDHSAAAAFLYQDNYQSRKKIRELEDQLAAARGQMPDKDAIILGPRQAPTWQAYRELGEPDEIAQTLEEAGRVRRSLAIREAADVTGFIPDVLNTLVKDGQQLIIETDEEGNKVAQIIVEEGADPAPLDDYATENWKPFLPALQPKTDDAPQGPPDIDATAGGTGTQPVTKEQREKELTRRIPALRNARS